MVSVKRSQRPPSCSATPKMRHAAAHFGHPLAQEALDAAVTALDDAAMTDVLGGECYPSDEKITFRAWDVRLFRTNGAGAARQPPLV
jgi:hypothetical protein